MSKNARTIRFYGKHHRLVTWRQIVAELTGREATAPVNSADPVMPWQFQMDVELTGEERKKLMSVWYAKVETTTDHPSGYLLGWNDCISFEEL